MPERDSEDPLDPLQTDDGHVQGDLAGVRCSLTLYSFNADHIVRLLADWRTSCFRRWTPSSQKIRMLRQGVARQKAPPQTDKITFRGAVDASSVPLGRLFSRDRNRRLPTLNRYTPLLNAELPYSFERAFTAREIRSASRKPTKALPRPSPINRAAMCTFPLITTLRHHKSREQ